MKKPLSLLILFSFLSLNLHAQSSPNAEPYGKVDTADLKMTSCDFEPDANAEVLFDKGVMHLESGLSMDRHIRIKIFNDFGKKYATIHLIYHSGFLQGKSIGGLDAETINLENNKIVVTPVGKDQIYNKRLNKKYSEFVFTFPNVKAGSIVEYKLRTEPIPVWFFQNDLPTRYSEIQTVFVYSGMLTVIVHTRHPVVFDNSNPSNPIQRRVMTYLHSLPDEPYMTARVDNLERVEFFFGSGFLFNTWQKFVDELIKSKAFGDELDVPLPGEETIIKRSDGLKNDEQRSAFIFDTVKTLMTWNKNTFFLATDDLLKAWQSKTGNSAEINLILFHLLRVVGLNVFPMVLSTRDHGKIEQADANPYALNTTVVYVKLSKSKYYILDASNKANLYNTVPYNCLNTNGLSIDVATGTHSFIHLQDTSRVIQSVFLNAEIKPDGTMTGIAEIGSDSYNKTAALEKYNADGEKKYIDSLHVSNNNISISTFKMENISVDTIPLAQKISFKMELTGSDENYIYFNLNSFTYLKENPFKEEHRYSDNDFGFINDYSINGLYKIPPGYKVEALPKNITIIMPDHSIIFKRTVFHDNGMISVRCVIEHGKTFYPMEEYQYLRGFYAEMYQLLNEPVVLKKS